MRRDNSDWHCGTGVTWEGRCQSLTKAKPHICVPLLGVFCAVNQVVGLKESVPYAEGSGSQKQHRWERPPSCEQRVNKCPRKKKVIKSHYWRGKEGKGRGQDRSEAGSGEEVKPQNSSDNPTKLIVTNTFPLIFAQSVKCLTCNSFFFFFFRSAMVAHPWPSTSDTKTCVGWRSLSGTWCLLAFCFVLLSWIFICLFAL